MKKMIYLHFAFLSFIVQVHSAKAEYNLRFSSRFEPDGPSNWDHSPAFTNGQLAYIDCTASNEIYVRAFRDEFFNLGDSHPKTWSVSSNFNYVVPDDDYKDIIKINLDPNFVDGSVTFTEDGITVNVYITRKSTPSLTIVPKLCSSGQSGDFSTTLNFYGPSSANVVWETTGGITVNGGNFYRVIDNTISRATIQHNSFGTVTVYGEIPGCNNMRTKSVVQYVGTPTASNITFRAEPDPGFTLCSGQAYGFASTVNLPTPLYSYNWSIPIGSNDVGYFYSSGPNATVGSTSGSGNGGFILQMDVTNTDCNTTNSTSRTFQITNCGGGYRVANNPTNTNKLTLLFEPVDDDKYLPSTMRISHEKQGVVKEIPLRAATNKEAARNGLSFDIDVQELVKGTYFLQGFYDNGKVESTRIVIE